MKKKKIEIKIEIKSLLKKIGFYRTLQIMNYDGIPIEIHKFYEKFNKEGYHNQFLRIKKELLKKDIIQIKKAKNRKRMISLTGNGIVLKLRIRDIIQQLEKGEN